MAKGKTFKAKIIESSPSISALSIELGGNNGQRLAFLTSGSMGRGKNYLTHEVVAFEDLGSESSRSAGKMAAGAIAGGLLTGGVGLVAGAALGARKKHQGAYLAVFSDNKHVAFTVTDKDILLKLKVLAAKK